VRKPDEEFREDENYRTRRHRATVCNACRGEGKKHPKGKTVEEIRAAEQMKFAEVRKKLDCGPLFDAENI